MNNICHLVLLRGPITSLVLSVSQNMCFFTTVGAVHWTHYRDRESILHLCEIVGVLYCYENQTVDLK
jgi:hypothetical protein